MEGTAVIFRQGGLISDMEDGGDPQILQAVEDFYLKKGAQIVQCDLPDAVGEYGEQAD